jgi:hypothetical protein
MDRSATTKYHFLNQFVQPKLSSHRGFYTQSNSQTLIIYYMSIATAHFPFSFNVVSRDVNTTNEEILKHGTTVLNDNAKTISQMFVHIGLLYRFSLYFEINPARDKEAPSICVSQIPCQTMQNIVKHTFRRQRHPRFDQLKIHASIYRPLRHPRFEL